MKLSTSILLIATLALGAPAFAAKKGKKGKGGGEGKKSLAAILKQYDKNGNHQIDGAEIDDLRAAFIAAAPGAR